MVVDLHAHPAFKSEWFGFDIVTTSNKKSLVDFFTVDPLCFNPLVVRSDFDKLKRGEVSVLLSTVYAVERDALRRDLRIKILGSRIPIIKLLRPLSLFEPFRSFWKHHVKKDYFYSTLRSIKNIEEAVKKTETVTVARNSDDLSFLSEGKTVLVHALEGAHNLEGENIRELRRKYPFGSKLSSEQTEMIRTELLDNLSRLVEKRVAVIGLCHYYPNEIIASCFSFPERTLEQIPFREWKKLLNGHTIGLTEIGREVVRKMFEHGVIVDISHVSPEGRKEIYEIAGEYNGEYNQGKVIASHIGVKALYHHAYNLDDWEIRWIADHGGVIGIMFSNFWLSGKEHAKLGLGMITNTIDHVLNAGGADVIAFGSDFDGFSDPPDDIADASEWHYLRDYLTCQYKLLNDTIGRKYTDEQLEQFFWKNALETLKNGWTA